jgi:cytochrome b561
MTRVWDYISFAIWFAGLGYIVMWLLGSPDHLTLPPALHAIGMTAAVLVPVRLFLQIVKRRRAAPAIPRQPAAVLRPVRRKAVYPVRAVKPRSHFGLRNVPH